MSVFCVSMLNIHVCGHFGENFVWWPVGFGVAGWMKGMEKLGFFLKKIVFSS